MSETLISRYIELLKDYNEHTNIYSKKAYDHLPFHIQDSLLISNFITSTKQRILDIGSGSGLPAIPMAIAMPKNAIIAVESKSRKTRFLELAKHELGLDNLEIRNENINEYIYHSLKLRVDVVTAKAFSSYEKLRLITNKLKGKKPRIIMPISKEQMDEYRLQKYPNISFKTIEDHLYLVRN